MKPLLSIYKDNACTFEESSFWDRDGNRWSARYLYEKAAGLKPERVHLRHIDISGMPWSNGGINSIDNFIAHMYRVTQADTSIPVIMSHDGFIMDGWHRVARAILDGKKSIMAYRFEVYIEPEEKA
jgi:hypothetical protein